MSSTGPDNLSTLLADYQVFYQKLRGYHWNVTGPNFLVLHQQFETLYTEVAVVIDDLAERIRSLGETPPSTLAAALKLARLKEDETTPDASTMVKNLLADLTALNGYTIDARTTAEQAEDLGSVMALDELIPAQQKAMWMLRAYGV